MLRKCVEENHAVSPSLLTEEHQKSNDDADKRLSTHVCLASSDQNKHGSVIKNSNIQKCLKNDQCPTTTTDTHNALSNHAHEKRP